jgi:ATP synthase protein I
MVSDMSDYQSPPPSLDDLDARLRKARERNAGPAVEAGGDDDLPRKSLGLAFRIGIEMVAAMIVGVGGGMLLDRWLGTTPWGLIGMFFLGAGAGIVNVYRAVSGIGYAPGYRKEPEPKNGSEQ